MFSIPFWMSGPSRTAGFDSDPLTVAGRDAARVHGSGDSSLRHAKYLPPVSGGRSIGPGTKSRMSGNRKNFWARVRSSCGGSRRNPYASDPLKLKPLFPKVITGGSRLAVKICMRWASVSGKGLSAVELNSAGGSAAYAVNADTKQSRKTLVFIKPLS